MDRTNTMSPMMHDNDHDHDDRLHTWFRHWTSPSTIELEHALKHQQQLQQLHDDHDHDDHDGKKSGTNEPNVAHDRHSVDNDHRHHHLVTHHAHAHAHNHSHSPPATSASASALTLAHEPHHDPHESRSPSNRFDSSNDAGYTSTSTSSRPRPRQKIRRKRCSHDLRFDYLNQDCKG